MLHNTLNRVAVSFVAVGLGLWVASVSATQSQVIHPAQLVVPHSLDVSSSSEADSGGKDPMKGDLEKGFERPMQVPDTDMSVFAEQLNAPNAIDAEEARESDIRSAVSF